MGACFLVRRDDASCCERDEEVSLGSLSVGALISFVSTLLPKAPLLSSTVGLRLAFWFLNSGGHKAQTTVHTPSSFLPVLWGREKTL